MNSYLLAVLAALAACALASKQTVGARGTLMCGNQPLAGATVKLWELDVFPDPDDELAKVKTDAQGRFQISGSESEITTIDTVVKIYHNCNNKWGLCKRKVTYKVPSSYVNKGSNVNKWYDLGVLNMEAKIKGEETECI